MNPCWRRSHRTISPWRFQASWCLLQSTSTYTPWAYVKQDQQRLDAAIATIHAAAVIFLQSIFAAIPANCRFVLVPASPAPVYEMKLAAMLLGRRRILSEAFRQCIQVETVFLQIHSHQSGIKSGLITSKSKLGARRLFDHHGIQHGPVFIVNGRFAIDELADGRRGGRGNGVLGVEFALLDGLEAGIRRYGRFIRRRFQRLDDGR
jgi:hypothetical protein